MPGDEENLIPRTTAAAAMLRGAAPKSGAESSGEESTWKSIKTQPFPLLHQSAETSSHIFIRPR